MPGPPHICPLCRQRSKRGAVCPDCLRAERPTPHGVSVGVSVRLNVAALAGLPPEKSRAILEGVSRVVAANRPGERG